MSRVEVDHRTSETNRAINLLVEKLPPLLEAVGADLICTVLSNSAIIGTMDTKAYRSDLDVTLFVSGDEGADELTVGGGWELGDMVKFPPAVVGSVKYTNDTGYRKIEVWVWPVNRFLQCFHRDGEESKLLPSTTRPEAREDLPVIVPSGHMMKPDQIARLIAGSGQVIYVKKKQETDFLVTEVNRALGYPEGEFRYLRTDNQMNEELRGKMREKL